MSGAGSGMCKLTSQSRLGILGGGRALKRQKQFRHWGNIVLSVTLTLKQYDESENKNNISPLKIFIM